MEAHARRLLCRVERSFSCRSEGCHGSRVAWELQLAPIQRRATWQWCWSIEWVKINIFQSGRTGFVKNSLVNDRIHRIGYTRGGIWTQKDCLWSNFHRYHRTLMQFPYWIFRVCADSHSSWKLLLEVSIAIVLLGSAQLACALRNRFFEDLR